MEDGRWDNTDLELKRAVLLKKAVEARFDASGGSKVSGEHDTRFEANGSRSMMGFILASHGYHALSDQRKNKSS